MANLTCDLCGGSLEIGAGGAATCTACGVSYTKERMAEKVHATGQNVLPEQKDDVPTGKSTKPKTLVIALAIAVVILAGIVVALVVSRHTKPEPTPSTLAHSTMTNSLPDADTTNPITAGGETAKSAGDEPTVEAVRATFLAFVQLEEYWFNEDVVVDRVKAQDRYDEAHATREQVCMRLDESRTKTVEDLKTLFRPYCTEKYINQRVDDFGYIEIDGLLSIMRGYTGYGHIDVMMESVQVNKDSDTRFTITAFGENCDEDMVHTKTDVTWIYEKQNDGTWKITSKDIDTHNWTQEIKTVSTQGSDLRVRSATRISEDNIVGSISTGTEVIVLRNGYDWSYIITKDRLLEGYVASEYLVYANELW